MSNTKGFYHILLVAKITSLETRRPASCQSSRSMNTRGLVQTVYVGVGFFAVMSLLKLGSIPAVDCTLMLGESKYNSITAFPPFIHLVYDMLGTRRKLCAQIIL